MGPIRHSTEGRARRARPAKLCARLPKHERAAKAPAWRRELGYRGSALLYAILSPFVVALLTPWLVRRWAGAARGLAAWPALLTVLLVAQLRDTLHTGPRLVELPWAPSLHLALSFTLDGLGLLFALLITGDRRAGRALRQPLLAGHPQAGRLYRVPVCVHGRDAGRGAQRQRPRALRVLGADRLHLVPADRLRPRAGGRAVGRPAGAARHRRRRPGAARAGVLLVERLGDHQPGRDGRQRRRPIAGHPLYAGDRGARAPCRVHQVGAVPVPLLAAQRDGGADAGQRLPALGDDGQGRRLPGGAADAHPRRHATVWTTVVTHRRGGHDAGRAPTGPSRRPTSSASWRTRRSARSAC